MAAYHCFHDYDVFSRVAPLAELAWNKSVVRPFQETSLKDSKVNGNIVHTCISNRTDFRSVMADSWALRHRRPAWKVWLSCRCLYITARRQALEMVLDRLFVLGIICERPPQSPCLGGRLWAVSNEL